MIIPIETCSGLTDRISYQATQIVNALAVMGAPGGGDCFRRATAPQIYEVERDFITPGRLWETKLSGTTIFPLISPLSTLINAFDSHTQQEGAVSFDTFLSRSGLNVSNNFADTYAAIRNTSLSSINVFAETDTPMGSVQHLGAGAWAFTDGSVLGTGAGAYSATNHCAQQLLAYLGSGVTVSTTCTLTVTATKEDGSSTSKTVAFTSADPANTHKVIGASTDQFLAVTNITVTGSPTGTPTVFVRQIRERVPGL